MESHQFPAPQVSHFLFRVPTEKKIMIKSEKHLDRSVSVPESADVIVALQQNWFIHVAMASKKHKKKCFATVTAFHVYIKMMRIEPIRFSISQRFQLLTCFSQQIRAVHLPTYEHGTVLRQRTHKKKLEKKTCKWTSHTHPTQKPGRSAGEHQVAHQVGIKKWKRRSNSSSIKLM